MGYQDINPGLRRGGFRGGQKPGAHGHKGPMNNNSVFQIWYKKGPSNFLHRYNVLKIKKRQLAIIS